MTYHDGAPLSSDQLRGSSLTIRSSGGTAGNHIHIPSEREQLARDGWLRNGTFIPETGERPGNRAFDRDPLLDPLWGAVRAQRKYAEARQERYLNNQRWAEYRSMGLHRFELSMPPRGSSVELTATFSGDEGGATSSTLRLEPFYSQERNIISVETSNRRTDVGEYAVFHVRSNFPMTHFFLIVSPIMSRGCNRDSCCVPSRAGEAECT